MLKRPEHIRRRPKKFLFTSRQQSTPALVSVILGLISCISVFTMIHLAYKNDGQAQLRYGAVVFVCLLFSIIGLILSILSRLEPDKWRFSSYLGMVLNGLVVLICFITMYLGV